MATSDWRATALNAFRTGRTDPAVLRAALARARTLNGAPEEAWKNVGFDWLENLGRQPDGPSRLETLQCLLDAGLDPDGGVPLFAHLPLEERRIRTAAYHQALGGSRPLGDSVRRVRLGALFRSHESHQHCSVPWLGRTAWLGRDLPDLPQLIAAWLDAGANPHARPAQPSTPHPDDDSGAVSRLLTGAWSSWPNLLAVGRDDVLDAVFARLPPGERPTDWALAVAHALEATVHHDRPLAPVARAVVRFAERFPPTPAERAAVTRLLKGRGRTFRRPAALAAWLSIPAAGLGAPAEADLQWPDDANPWAALVDVTAETEAVHAELFEILRRHPRWGAALAAAPLRQAGLAWSTAPAEARVVDGWALASDRIRPAPALVGRLLAHASAQRITVSPAFPALLADVHDPPGAAATAWLASQGGGWARAPSGDTPWHAWPRPPVRAWLIEQGISARQANDAGVPGLLAGALVGASEGRSGVLEAFEEARQWPVPPSDTVVQGLPWSAWGAAFGCVPFRPTPPIETLEACLRVRTPAAVKAWAKAHPGWRWAELTDGQQRGLLHAWTLALRHPAQKRPAGTFALGADEEEGARILGALRETTGSEGLSPTARLGWLSAVGRASELTANLPPPALLEAWRWMDGVPYASLPLADRKALADAWRACLLVANPGEGSAVAWPWEAEAWRAMDGVDRADLAWSVLRVAMQKKHWAGLSLRLSRPWFDAFVAHALDGEAERLWDALPAHRHAWAAQVANRLEQWETHHEAWGTVPFLGPLRAALRSRELGQSWATPLSAPRKQRF